MQQGLVDLGGGCAAYLQPDGSWGLSNAGLVTASGHALLVDTLYDLGRTRALLDAARARGSIDVVVNTHANGDHCYGNQAVVDANPGVRIVSTTAARDEMPEVKPSLMAFVNRAMRLVELLPSALTSRVPVGPTSARDLAGYWLGAFGRFEFGGIVLTPPTETFDGSLELCVGDVEVRVLELGPAHTRGDAAVFVPSTRTLYTGDLLFHRGTPIVWAGPLSKWIAACDTLAALDPAVVVPGHGPLADTAALLALRDYLRFVDEDARPLLLDGAPALDVARALLASERFRHGPWSTWSEPERIAVNVEAVAREVRGDPPKKPFALFAAMAALTAATSTPRRR